MPNSIQAKRPRSEPRRRREALVVAAAVVSVALMASSLTGVRSFTFQRPSHRGFGIDHHHQQQHQHQQRPHDGAVFFSRWDRRKIEEPCTRVRMSDRSNDYDEKEETLYEILGASPDATRSELKRKYVALARLSHPDARIGKTPENDDDDDGNDVDFQQIAEAWRTLGDPKARRRYDRQLKAKAWGEAAQKLTNERLEQVAPVASSFVDNLAVPFLRKTSQVLATGFKATSAVSATVSAAAASAAGEAPKQQESDDAKDTVTPSSSSTTNDSTDLQKEPPAVAESPTSDIEVVQAEAATPDETESTGIAVESYVETEKAIEIEETETISPAMATAVDSEETDEESSETVDGVTGTNDFIQEQTNDVDETTITALDEADDAETPLDLDEHSEEEILELVKNEEEKIKHVHQELYSVKEQRLFASVESPDYAISSCEAKELLDHISDETAESEKNRGKRPQKIEKEIEQLRDSEDQFTEKLENYSEIDRQWNEWLTKQEDAKKVLSEKKEGEREARQRLVIAEQEVVIADKDVRTVSSKLRGVEQEVRKSAVEMERVSTTVFKKQARVRNALRRKTQLMKGGITVQYVTAEEVRMLRRKETQLMGESKQIATMVARLQSRADKLQQRAAELEELKSGNY